mmetsp:Transcript_29451/g.73977  ORF Transcript_29451/g.73977 Transcript_29451/m.73977 type:complete len:267 (+) Transcript_29451:916-1716(+)
MASPAASPATAESENKTFFNSSYISFSSDSPSQFAMAARPRPRQAPCWTISLVPALRRASKRYFRESMTSVDALEAGLSEVPPVAEMMPSAYSPPPSEYAEDDVPWLERYGERRLRALDVRLAWMTPRQAVAENLFHDVARASQSRFSRRKESIAVPEWPMAFAKTRAAWHTELRWSIDERVFLRVYMSKLFFEHKKSSLSMAEGEPESTKWTFSRVGRTVSSASAAAGISLMRASLKRGSSFSTTSKAIWSATRCCSSDLEVTSE